jgi:hypothetical protein
MRFTQVAPNEYGGWMPIDAEQRATISVLGREGAEGWVKSMVRRMLAKVPELPPAEDIRVVLHLWDDSDPYIKHEAIERYGYPEDTMGTIGWRVRFADMRTDD